jgi:hypothetical protein
MLAPLGPVDRPLIRQAVSFLSATVRLVWECDKVDRSSSWPVIVAALVATVR